MTATMEEYRDLNILILGCSFAGISAAHHIYREAIPELRANNKNFSYRVTIVSPNTHIYWNISAPRAIVSPKLISHDQSFVPLAEGFADYKPENFEFIQGTATDLDTQSCTVTVACPVSSNTGTEDEARLGRMTFPSVQDNKKNNTAGKAGYSDREWYDPASTERELAAPPIEERVIKYHALIIATGTTAHSPLLSLRGPHENTRAAIDSFHIALPAAQSIIVAGGGPSGVEVAGQIAYYYNNQPNGRSDRSPSGLSSLLHRLRRGVSSPHAKTIVVVCGTSRLLPNLNPQLGARAHRQLTDLGVRVLLGVRVEGASVAGATGQTTVKLSSGGSLVADLYVPCTGVRPNTQFLPFDSPLLKDGWIATTKDLEENSTLRVKVPIELLPDSCVTIEQVNNGDDITIDASSTPLISTHDKLPPGKPTDTHITSTALPRIYAIGDCADYSTQCVLDVYASLTTLHQNLILDLQAYQLATSNPYGGNAAAVRALLARSMAYVRDDRDSQLVPVGGRRPGGVGALLGFKVPGLMVWVLKGRTYTVERAGRVVREGVSPYPAQSGAKRKG